MDLKTYLKDKSVEVFAHEIGVSVSTVYRWIERSRLPSLANMAAISKKTKNKVKYEDFLK